MPEPGKLLEQYFRKVALFQHISPGHAAKILGDFTFREARKGEVVVSRGEEGAELFILLRGRVRVTLTSDEGEEFVLNELEAGASFGEVSLIDGRPRTANVVAAADSSFAVLRRERFLAAMRGEPQIAFDLLISLAGLLRNATEREERFAFLDVRQRLLAFFAGRVREEGAEEKGGFVRIVRRTHRELATRIGTSRESVTKTLKFLAREGVVREEGDCFLLSCSILGD